MRSNGHVVAAILAVLAIPFAIAAIQDIGARSREEAAPPASGEAPPAEPQPPVAEPEPPRSDWQRAPIMDQRFFEEVFGVGDVRVPGPVWGPALRGAPFGMPPDRVRAEVPALVAWSESGSADFPAAEIDLRFEPGLTAIVLRFPDNGSARRVLAAAWGPPVAAVGIDGEVRHAWIDPGSLRVVLREEEGAAEVVYQPLLEMPALSPRARGRRILGATEAELREAYGPAFAINPLDPDEGRLQLNPAAWARSRTECVIRFRDERVAAFELAFDHEWKADEGALAASALGAGIGPVRATTTDHGRTVLSFDGGIAIERREGEPRVFVRVGRP